MKPLAIVLALLGILAMVAPHLVGPSDEPLLEILPLIGILFLGVGASLLVARLIIPKK